MRPIQNILASLCLIAFGGVGATSAAELSARERVGYQIALAGINVGDFAIELDRDGDLYNVRAEGSYRVLFWSGTLSSTVVGEIAPDGLRPSFYMVSTESASPSKTVIEFEPAIGPATWQRTPKAPSEWNEGRTALQRDHLRPAVDPISAIVASALASTGGTTPEVCDRPIRIFTGFSVFELDFNGAKPGGFGRVECEVSYRPLSGHRAESQGVERLSQPGSIQIAFDRLPGGNWFPGRISLPTRIGTLTIDRI